MALIKCPECGSEISDKAVSCPHCGAPLNRANTPKPSPQSSNDYSNKYRTPKPDNNSGKVSALSIVSLILSIIGCTYLFGIICAIVDLTKKDGRKKVCSIIALCIGILWFFFAIIFWFSVPVAENSTEPILSAETAVEEFLPTESQSKTVMETIAESVSDEDDDIPSEYKSALNKANSYSDIMHMSKQGIYDQLVSEYGEQFSAEAAQYAIDNMEADWNYNALQSAQSYSDTMHMSKQGIYDQLISEYGGQFTPEEAQYAVDNVDADWNYNALETAKNYQETLNMSPEAIRDQLTTEYGGQFTAEEAAYAIENLD